MKLAYLPVVLSLAFTGTALAGSDAVAPDNTKKNQRDQKSDTVTPGDQGENKADIAITAAIRRKVMKEHVSTDAKNVKIVTVAGVVTLRGPVKTEAEKTTIASAAQGVDGVKQVDNQLEVITKK